MNRKILVVEDDPSALRLVGYTLEQEGYQVITASDGLEGVRKARDEHPDLIILDVMLPGLDGYEVCQQLRKKPETANLPILMLTAKAREMDKDTGLKVGADDYLAKHMGAANLRKGWCLSPKKEVLSCLQRKL